MWVDPWVGKIPWKRKQLLRSVFLTHCGSDGKESTCNAEDPSLIPETGRSLGEGIDYLLQYSCASLVAQTVKNLPAMQETWVQSLGWEDPLEKGMEIHSSILAWRIPMDRGAWQATVHAVAKDPDMTEHSRA